MIEVKDETLTPSTEIEIVEDGMIGDGDNGIPKIEVDPATGDPITQTPETVEVPKYSELNAVKAALGAQPVEFEKEINGLLADRLEAAVERRREEVAKSVFNGEVSEPEAVAPDAQEGAEPVSSEPKQTTEEEVTQPEE